MDFSRRFRSFPGQVSNSYTEPFTTQPGTGLVQLTLKPLPISINRLSRRLQALQAEAKPGSKPILTFDKDDVDTLDFVAASANLRSTIFGIEPKSKFEIKRKLYLHGWCMYRGDKVMY